MFLRNLTILATLFFQHFLTSLDAIFSIIFAVAASMMTQIHPASVDDRISRHKQNPPPPPNLNKIHTLHFMVKKRRLINTDIHNTLKIDQQG